MCSINIHRFIIDFNIKTHFLGIAIDVKTVMILIAAGIIILIRPAYTEENMPGGQLMDIVNDLFHCGLKTPYSNRECQHWPR